MNRVYDFLAPVLGVGTAGALSLVLIFLLLGPFRKYWIVLAYVAWELLATVGFTIADLLYHGTAQVKPGMATHAQQLYARLYWTNDVIVDLFRFVLVIMLIYAASAGAKRRVSGHVLAAVVLAMMILPFVLFNRNPKPVEIFSYTLSFPNGAWFNSASEMLNFGAAIMNLMLWAILLPSKQRDPQLLMVSLGLGVVVTGTAFAYGVRFLGGAASGFLFMNLTQLIGWALWCRAFRPKRGSRQLVDHAVPTQ
jgi:hypothetical protein